MIKLPVPVKQFLNGLLKLLQLGKAANLFDKKNGPNIPRK